MIVMPATTAASLALASGKKTALYFLLLAIKAIGKTPLVWRREPSRDNSPRKRNFLTSASICSEANRIPKAIGRSYEGPCFGKSAGAKFTVIRCGGNSAPLFLMAERTLSFASSTDFDGRPTIVNDGRLLA